MKARLWVLPVLGFMALLGLIAGNGYWVMRRARAIHDEMIRAHQSYLRADTLLEQLTRDSYLGELIARDYLLDTSGGDAAPYQKQINFLRDSMRRNLQGLEPELDPGEIVELERLKAEAESYWQSLSLIFRWNREERRMLGQQFLQRDLQPRWSRVVSLADKLTTLNDEDLKKDQQRLEAAQNSFQRFLQGGLLLTMMLGMAVAAGATYGFVRLDARKEMHRLETERAQYDLRQLSRRLVGAQEAERKFISRELHDAVGQTLTAVGMELASLEAVRGDDHEYAARVAEIKRLNHESLSTIRDLAMGLRPSMLDDIGLRPALEWQGRQTSRSASIPVSVEFCGDMHGLPELQGTCIYRAVQEALTNCIRHAHARTIRVVVHVEPGSIVASVEDDGVGFEEVEGQRTGIGLLGIRERVEELGGQVRIMSGPGKGTKIILQVPNPHEASQ